MTGRPPDDDADNSSDAILMELVEQFSARLEAGEAADVDSFVREFPEHAEQLRRLLPPVQVLNELKSSAGRGQAAQAPPPDPSQVAPLVRGVLGDYRIVRRIGRGGMGVVYEAEQISLDRRVALKTLPFASVLDDRRIQRFRNEAKAAATLKHPNIVSVFAVGCERGVHYYAMELVEGHSLAEVIRHVQQADGQPSSDPGEAITTQAIAELSTRRSSDRKQYYRAIARLVAQVAHALDHAHSQGVVHRDIKPSNILVDQHGAPWVTDFGLAQIRTGGSLTLTGDVLGTARYMSPEQASGQAVVDHRTDVYSLGITLYELLTLRPAFDGLDHRALINSVIESEPTAPRKLDASIPADLETIVLKATAKEASQRYDTAGQLADDLRRFVDSRPVQARRLGRGQRLVRWARRNPGTAALVSVVGLLLFSLAATSTAFSVHLSGVAQHERQVADRETRLRREAFLFLYASDMNRAHEALRRGDSLGCEEILLRYVPDSPAPYASDPRHFEWYYLWNQSHAGNTPNVRRCSLDVFDVRYSSRSGTLAGAFWSAVRLWDGVTKSNVGKLRKKEGDDPRGPVLGFRFLDNDQSVVAAWLDGTISKWDVASGTELLAFDTDEDQRLWDVSVAPNRNLIAATHGTWPARYPADATGRVTVWDLQSGKRVARFAELGGRPCVAFSPDEKVLVTSDENGQLRLVDTSTWKITKAIRAHDCPILAIGFSPDGQMLATGGGAWRERFVADELKLWDTSRWTATDILRSHTGAICRLAFTRDRRNGNDLATGSLDGRITLWNLADRQPLKSFRAHSQEISGLAFSPDSAELASASFDRSCRVWRVSDLLDSSAERTVLNELGGMKRCLALTSDGRTVCYASRTGVIEVRDVATGESRFPDGTPQANTNTDMAISPDDQLLAVACGSFPVDPTRPGLVRLYRLADGELIHEIDTQHPFMRGIAFSPSGESLAVACTQYLQMWDVATGEKAGEVGPLDGQMKCVRFHPTKAQLVCSADGGMTRLFRTDPLTQIDQLQTDGMSTTSVDFSPDGRTFVTVGSDQVVKLWDAETRQLIRPFKKAADVFLHARFSHDGQRLLTTLRNGTVTLWHVGIGEPVLTFKLDSSRWVMCGEFSRDDGIIASAGLPVYLWRRGPQWKELQRLTLETIQSRCHPE